MVIKGKVEFIGNKKFIKDLDGGIQLYVQSFVIEKTEGEKLSQWNKYVPFDTLSTNHHRILSELGVGDIVSVTIGNIGGGKWIKGDVWQGDDWEKRVFLRLTPSAIEVVEKVNKQESFDLPPDLNPEDEGDLPF